MWSVVDINHTGEEVPPWVKSIDNIADLQNL